MNFLQDFHNTSVLNRTRRHYSYVGELNTEKCAAISDSDYDKRITFFQETEDCKDYDLIPYKKIMYYYLNPQSRSSEIGCLILFLLILVYVFIILGSVTDR